LLLRFSLHVIAPIEQHHDCYGRIRPKPNSVDMSADIKLLPEGPCPAGKTKRKGDRMTPDGFALAATIILLCLMFYFAMASLAFLLVKLEIPSVTQLLRGLFNVHFLVVSIAGVIGTVAFAVAGRLVVAIGIGLIAAFAVWARGWFLRRMDAQLSARDAGDANAVRQLRRLHWGGMLCNAVQLVAMVASLPYVFVTST
jgi:hypothetical protein